MPRVRVTTGTSFMLMREEQRVQKETTLVHLTKPRKQTQDQTNKGRARNIFVVEQSQASTSSYQPLTSTTNH